MEHRSDFRTYASINLLIYQSGFPVTIGITRDISNTGMFVKTNYVCTDADKVLEFELLFSRKNPNVRKRYRAVITAQRGDGLVLEFDATCNHDARKLAAMVEWVATIQGKNCPRTHNRLVLIPNAACSVR